MKKLITISLLTLTLLFSAVPSETNEKAISYLKNKEIQKAYELLVKSYTEKNYDNQMLFLLGTSAKQLGEFNQAIQYFEELLQRDKKALRVKLDLASVYYQTHNLKKAKELLLEVKATQPPKKVGDNIDTFLAVIDKGIPKAWSINFGIGYQYDSNVNAGPDTETVLMYGLPFTLDKDAKDNSDTAFKYNFRFNHIKKINGISLQTSISASATDYKDINSLDSQSLSASFGPSWRNGKIAYSVPLVTSVQKIGHTDRYYSYSRGISPQLSFQVNDRLSIATSLSLSNKRYYKNRDKESNSYTISPSTRYFLDQSSYLTGGFYFGEENSHTRTSSNNSHGLNIGYFKAFSQKLNMYASTSWSTTDYKGIETAYSKSREDENTTYGLNFNYVFSKYDINASLNMSYTDNQSNISMYEYERKIIGLNFSKSF